MVPVNIFQAAWIVADLDDAIANWISRFGAGPFYKVEDFRMIDFRYGGEPAPEHFSSAIGQAGTMQVELIAPKTLSSPLFALAVEPGGARLHHFGCIYSDFDAALAEFKERDVEMLGEGTAGALRYAFADTRKTLGALTEVIDGSDPGLVQRVAAIALAARDWDGSNPVRDWTPAQ